MNLEKAIEKAFDMAKSLEYNMIPYELQEGIDQSREIVAHACTKKTVGIFIGPEGGFDKQEVSKASACGFCPISLGKRILRTEPAGMTVLSILMYHMETDQAFI